MNKYVLNTSLVWIAVLAAVGAAFYFHGRSQAPPGMGAPAAAAEATPAAAAANAPAALAPVQLTPQRLQSIGVTIGTAEYKRLTDDIRATGSVNIDQRLISYVQVRFPGYIRQVFANAVYQYVRQGEPLFTVYSPDLVATEQEYLLARQDQQALRGSPVNGVAAGAAALAAAAQQRLEQWQVPPSELKQLETSGKPITDLTVNSPVSGYITDYNALPNMYIEPSTRLYTVADLSRVWVDAQVFQSDVGRLQPGDPAAITVNAYPGRIFSGSIEQILPQVDMATRTAQVRLAIANPGLKLKPGMFVNVDLKIPMGEHVAIPATGVLQSGTRQIVFVDQGGGNLEPRYVQLGARAGDDFIVLQGLKAGERIVTSANFLIDSESQLQAALGTFVPPPPGAGAAGAMNAPRANVELTTEPNPPHKGTNTFRVKLTDSGGAPITGAEVSVILVMPAMPAMGMAAMRVPVTLGDRGNGVYEGSGQLGSGGTWQVSILAKKNGQVVASKQLSVNAAGGM